MVVLNHTAPPIRPIDLPAMYDELTRAERVLVRNEYELRQGGLCHYCGKPLTGLPSPLLLKQAWSLDRSGMPEGFFDHPVHLHHSHQSGLTIGAVHAVCNAVLWQYHGE